MVTTPPQKSCDSRAPSRPPAASRCRHVPSAQQHYDVPAKEWPSVPHLGEGGAWKLPSRGRLACPQPPFLRRCPFFFFRTPTISYGRKTSSEGNNSSSIRCATFLVYFLTIASSTGREIMISEIAGSILTVFPRKRRKKGIFSRSRTCKNSNHLKKKQRREQCIGSLQVTPTSKRSNWILGTSSGFLT